MLKEVGLRSLLRAIFPEKLHDASIRDVVTQRDGTILTLRDALNEALDTLPPTRGSGDSAPWARRKTVLDHYYGLSGDKLERQAIAQKLHTDPRYVSRIRRDVLTELRRNERVTQMLRAFFVLPP